MNRARRPLRYRGLRSMSGPRYWRARARLFGLLASFFGFGTLIDALGRLVGESAPRWSSLALVLAITVVFARLAYTSRKKLNDGSS
jgi:hypothetical protein